MTDAADREQSWKPLALAAAVFVALIGGTLISTLFRGDSPSAQVFSSTELNGTGPVQVGLGCEIRGRTLRTEAKYRASGSITSYSYTFGDGTGPSTVEVREGRPNPSAVYRYDKPGRFVVTLTLTSTGGTGEDTCTVDVR